MLSICTENEFARASHFSQPCIPFRDLDTYNKLYILHTYEYFQFSRRNNLSDFESELTQSIERKK